MNIVSEKSSFDKKLGNDNNIIIELDCCQMLAIIVFLEVEGSKI